MSFNSLVALSSIAFCLNLSYASTNLNAPMLLSSAVPPVGALSSNLKSAYVINDASSALNFVYQP